MSQVSRRHHYVPKFLMKPFCENGMFLKFEWNRWRSELSIEKRSPKSELSKEDLFRITKHPEGEDVIERTFFRDIDDHAARARDVLVRQGPNALTDKQRTDFVCLLLSLEARQPARVSALREEGLRLADQLDEDSELRALFEAEGATTRPSELFAQQTGTEWEDQFIPTLQKLCTNERVGRLVLNVPWVVRTVDPDDGEFILSDHPLFRFNAADHPDCIWFLPLGPQVAWLASRNTGLIESVRRMSNQRFVKEANKSSMGNTRVFVIGKTRRNESWIRKHIPRSLEGGPKAQG